VPALIFATFYQEKVGPTPGSKEPMQLEVAKTNDLTLFS